MFYGQCSELCGRNHAYMPIAVRVVSEQQFNAWLEECEEEIRDVARTEPGGAGRAQRSTARAARNEASKMAYGAAAGHDDHDTPTGWRRWLYSTNHKDIGTLYLTHGDSRRRRSAARSRSACARAAGARAAVSSPIRTPSTSFVTAHGLIMVFFMIMPALDRRLRQLVRATHDRRARHGVPAHEQHLVLVPGRGVDPARDVAVRRRARRRRSRLRRRLDRLSAALGQGRPSRPVDGSRDLRAASWPALRRSSAPSTSSPRSSTCARRA